MDAVNISSETCNIICQGNPGGQVVETQIHSPDNTADRACVYFFTGYGLVDTPAGRFPVIQLPIGSFGAAISYLRGNGNGETCRTDGVIALADGEGLFACNATSGTLRIEIDNTR
jgi:hypothetical protein